MRSPVANILPHSAEALHLVWALTINKFVINKENTMKRHLVKFALTFGITVLAAIVLLVVAIIGHALGMISPIVSVLFYCAIFAGGWVLVDYIFEK